MKSKLENEYILILLAVIIGLIVGLIAFEYANLINWFSLNLYKKIMNDINVPRYLLILLPSLGGLISGLLIHFGSITAKGHGIPAILSSIESKKNFLSARDLIVEGLASAFTISSGGSAGRIGPVIEIGAGIGDIIGQKFNFHLDLYQTVLGCGAAAAISSIFNAPLGGIMFVIEILYKRLEITRLSMIVISSISADAFIRSLSGNQPIFQLPDFQVDYFFEYILYIVLGIILGILAYLFIKLLYHVSNFNDKLSIPFWLKPGIGGLITGIIAYNIPEVMGTGLSIISDALNGKYIITTLFFITLLKIVATSFTLGLGGSGGIFAPGLLIGTSSGIIFGSLIKIIFPYLNILPISYGLVGMCGFISGVIHAPLTGVLIIFELTGNYGLIIPLLLVSVISSTVAKRLLPESIYSPRLFLKKIREKQ